MNEWLILIGYGLCAVTLGTMALKAWTALRPWPKDGRKAMWKWDAKTTETVNLPLAREALKKAMETESKA